jgi:hypothetical protein
MCLSRLTIFAMDQMYAHYNHPAPPQDQGQQWDLHAGAPASGFSPQAALFPAHLGNSGPSTEAHEAFIMNEGHAPDMGDFDNMGNLDPTNIPDNSDGVNIDLGSFFQPQTSNQFIVPGQDGSSAFQA